MQQTAGTWCGRYDRNHDTADFICPEGQEPALIGTPQSSPRCGASVFDVWSIDDFAHELIPWTYVNSPISTPLPTPSGTPPGTPPESEGDSDSKLAAENADDTDQIFDIPFTPKISQVSQDTTWPDQPRISRGTNYGDLSPFRHRTLNGLLGALDLGHEASSTASSLGKIDSNVSESKLLRGIHVTTLLDKFGHHFEEAVQYNQVAQSQACVSFEVDSLDDFISHSWRAGRWPKYLALLLVYNNVASISLCAFFSIITFVCWGWLPEMSERNPIKSYCCISGFVFYIFGTQWTQQIRKILRLGLRTVFFDKLCIDQKDAARLAAGIKSLSTFLAKSRRMVILWDQTYFTRAWCVFEVAIRQRQMMKQHHSSNVLFVPVQLACSIATLCFSCWIICGVIVVFLNMPGDIVVDKVVLLGVSQLAVISLGMFSSMVGRQYARDVEHLTDSLTSFSWAKCECRSPDDYEGLGALLVHWFGGITEFDSYVSGSFRSLVLEQLGGDDSVSFVWTLPACMAAFCCQLDYVAFAISGGDRDVLGHISLWCFILTSSFFAAPLSFKVFLKLCEHMRAQRTSRWFELLLNLAITIVTFTFAVVTFLIPAGLDKYGKNEGNPVYFLLQLAYDVVIIGICIRNFRSSFSNCLGRLLVIQGRGNGDAQRKPKVTFSKSFSFAKTDSDFSRTQSHLSLSNL